MNNSKEYRIIVIGGDHYNTYGIVRSLGEEGICSYVLILGKKKGKSFVLKSRYVKIGFCFNSHDEVIDQLLSSFDDRTTNIVICCSDEAEELILEQYDKLKDGFLLPVCKDYRETIRLMNKDAITELANKYYIRTPHTWQVINRIIPEGIVFPVITKPIVSTQGHKSDIVVCRSDGELRAVVENQAHCADYLVQEYIEFEKEISILGAVLNDGTVCFSGCIDKIRTCSIGTSSFAKMIDNSILGETKDKLDALMRKTQYRGLFSAEFLKKADKLYFLEVNFRNDGNTYVATASGNNLPYRYVASFLDNMQQISYKATYPCFFMLDIEDFMARRKNKVTFSQWKKDLKTANCCLVYNREDKKPFYKKIRLQFDFYWRLVLRKLGANT